MLVFPLAGALAQNAQIDDFPDAQRRLQEQLERTDDAAYRARIGRLLDSGGDVSYADVLGDPDNIGLNYRFAQTQIRQGNIRGASATLERILLLDPQRPDVRLLYAVVLFRLDNLNDAQRELLAVRDVPMSAELRAEVDGLLSQIDQRRRRLRAELLVSLGVQYDWNGNSAQRSNSRLVVDTPLTLNDSDERHREISTNGTVQVSADYDLGLNRRHKAIASVSAYRSEHVHEDQLDLEAGTGQGGLSLAYEPVTVEPKLSVSKIRLAHQRYLTITRAETLATYQATKTSSLYAGVGLEDQHYNGLHVSTSAGGRTGRQKDLRIGGNTLAEPTLKLGAHVRFYDKDAREKHYAYFRSEAGANATKVLSGGMFVIGSLVYQNDRYDRNEAFVSALTRRDWSVRARLLVGFPLSNLFDESVAGLLDGVTATASAERYMQVSNLPDYTYRNNTFTLGLTRKWSF